MLSGQNWSLERNSVTFDILRQVSAFSQNSYCNFDGIFKDYTKPPGKTLHWKPQHGQISHPFGFLAKQAYIRRAEQQTLLGVCSQCAQYPTSRNGTDSWYLSETMLFMLVTKIPFKKAIKLRRFSNESVFLATLLCGFQCNVFLTDDISDISKLPTIFSRELVEF
jgi:hypothetical protein